MIDLRECPAFLRKPSNDWNGERMVGWKAMTDPTVRSGQAIVVGYMLITDVGYYEFRTDGVCVRAAVLHGFPGGGE